MVRALDLQLGGRGFSPGLSLSGQVVHTHTLLCHQAMTVMPYIWDGNRRSGVGALCLFIFFNAASTSLILIESAGPSLTLANIQCLGFWYIWAIMKNILVSLYVPSMLCMQVSSSTGSATSSQVDEQSAKLPPQHWHLWCGWNASLTGVGHHSQMCLGFTADYAHGYVSVSVLQLLFSVYI